MLAHWTSRSKCRWVSLGMAHMCCELQRMKPVSWERAAAGAAVYASAVCDWQIFEGTLDVPLLFSGPCCEANLATTMDTWEATMQTHITDVVSQLRPHAATGRRAVWAQIHRPSVCPTAQN